jgi:Gluconate 2-dehydrogenase subunit 3
MPDRYPGYDVLAKRHTPSWNEKTREVIDRRLALPRTPRFLSEPEFATVEAIAAQVVPQPKHRPPVPVAALVDARLFEDIQDGYRVAGLPREREAWQRGLLALNAEAEAAHRRAFRHLTGPQQHDLLKRMEQGDLKTEAWGDMPPKAFFKHRLLSDIVHAYWSHPTSWNEIGWGGPASPRGYVRMGYDERDPWEAVEAHGDPDDTRRRNRHVG